MGPDPGCTYVLCSRSHVLADFVNWGREENSENPKRTVSKYVLKKGVKRGKTKIHTEQPVFF